MKINTKEIDVVFYSQRIKNAVKCITYGVHTYRCTQNHSLDIELPCNLEGKFLIQLEPNDE